MPAKTFSQFLAIFLLGAATPHLSAEDWVIRNVHLIPMAKNEVIRDQTVVIRDGEIAMTGDGATVEVPDGARVVDGRGGYLLPGLADMHTHINESFIEESYLNLFIANGVTTIRDLTQGSAASIHALAEEVERGKRVGPRIIPVETIWGWERDPSQSVAAVRDQGYAGAKLNSYFTREEFIETQEACSEAGLYNFGHIPYTISLEDLQGLSYREVTHVLELSWFLADRQPDFPKDPKEAESQVLGGLLEEIRVMAEDSVPPADHPYFQRIPAIVDEIGKTSMAFTTTLACDRDMLNQMNNMAAIQESRYAPYIAEKFWSDIETGQDKYTNLFEHPGMAWIVSEFSQGFFRELHEEGSLMVLGTDVGPTYLSLVPGFAVHDELEIMVENGLTPFEALTLATKNAAIIAERMGVASNFGTIEIGQRADMVLLAGNPLEDIRNVRDIQGVVANGTYLSQKELKQLLKVQKKPLKDRLMKVYKQKGPDRALAEYKRLKNDNRNNRWLYNDRTLNSLGYALLRSGSQQDALIFLDLNTREYPSSANARDSLGEYYLVVGDTLKARACYEKALEINPNFKNARKVLEELAAK